MSKHVIAYNPSDEMITTLLIHGNLLSEWNENNNREILVKLYDSLYNNKELEDFLHKEVRNNPNTIISKINSKSEIYEWLNTDKKFEDRLYITDILSNENVCDIINKESLGGDIRKYITSLYGGQKFSIKFSLYGSKKINTTSMEPMSISFVEKLLQNNIAPDNKNNDFPYPNAKQIIEWSNIVKEEWSLNCGSMGVIHNSYDNVVNVGFNGFVIYDANKKVKKWCDTKWDIKEINPPFMRPDEYDLRLKSEESVPISAIRMWWD